VPNCQGQWCGGDDGCGGICTACPKHANCNPVTKVCDCLGGWCGSSCCDYAQLCWDEKCWYGAWRDPTTGLVWQNPNSDLTLSFEEAMVNCTNNTAGLPGDGWRLPTIGELRTLIRGCPNNETGGNCTVDENGCLAWSCGKTCPSCSSKSGPDNGCYWIAELSGSCVRHLSSSSVGENPYPAVWTVDFSLGRPGVSGELDLPHNVVRCVR